MLKVLFPNGLKKAFTLSYDDGCYDDIRLIEMMSTRGIKGTFNLNSGLWRPERSEPVGGWPRMMPSETVAYENPLVEVAIHGVTHRDFTKISEPELMYEISADKKNLETRYKTVIRGSAYPYGSFDDQSVEALRKNGIKYCRTVWSDDSLKMPRDWLRLRPTAHHNDPKLDEIVTKFLEEPAPDQRMLYIWGHTPEFRRDGTWDRFEALLDRVARRDDTWYATNIEICEYDIASKALEYSVDGRFVYNPTAKEIWLEKGSDAISVKSGELLEI